MKKNNRGFTLVELLAVIVILGLLMAIAIPSVTKYITQSRVKTLTSTVDSYVTAVVTQVNDGDYKFSDSKKIYAIPIECVSLEKGGTNPFGNWSQSNDAYWAYVLVHYDSENYNYEYGFTFKDDAGYGLYPTRIDMIENSMIKTGYDDLKPPIGGLARRYLPLAKWYGFTGLTNTTQLVVLDAAREGEEGDGQTTCTLAQKGDNYESAVIKTVKIRSQSYKYEVGMTWGEWVESDYNTTSLRVRKDGTIYDGTIIDSVKGYLMYDVNIEEGCESMVDENDLVNRHYHYTITWSGSCYL